MDKFFNWEVTASSKIKNNGLAWLNKPKLSRKCKAKQKVLMHLLKSLQQLKAPDSFSGCGRAHST